MRDGKSPSFRYGMMKDFNASIPSCEGELGRWGAWEELAEVLKSWWRVPYAAPLLGSAKVASSRLGDVWLWSAVMISDPFSSSDTAGASMRRFGVPVPPPAAPGAEELGRTRWAIGSPYRRRRVAWFRNLRPRCCMPSGPCWSGTGRLHEGDDDNGVRMRRGIMKLEFQNKKGGLPARRHK
jgi:hypothetical protein